MTKPIDVKPFLETRASASLTGKGAAMTMRSTILVVDDVAAERQAARRTC